MIVSYKGKTAKAFAAGKRTKIPPELLQRIADKLTTIKNAEKIEDLRFPPSNHLELLKGDPPVNTVSESTNNGASASAGRTATLTMSRLSITTDKMMKTANETTPEMEALLNATPGGILLREFLEPYGLSQAEFARRTGIPASRLTEIVKGRRAITPETATAIAHFFGMEPRFWLNLQTTCDLQREELLNRADKIRARVRPLSPREKEAARRRAAAV